MIRSDICFYFYFYFDSLHVSKPMLRQYCVIYLFALHCQYLEGDTNNTFQHFIENIFDKIILFYQHYGSVCDISSVMLTFHHTCREFPIKFNYKFSKYKLPNNGGSYVKKASNVQQIVWLFFFQIQPLSISPFYIGNARVLCSFSIVVDFKIAPIYNNNLFLQYLTTDGGTNIILVLKILIFAKIIAKIIWVPGLVT